MINYFFKYFFYFFVSGRRHLVHLMDPKNSHVRCNGRGYTHILSHAYTRILRPLLSIWCNAAGSNMYVCVVVQGKLSLSSLRVKLLSLSLWVKALCKPPHLLPAHRCKWSKSLPSIRQWEALECPAALLAVLYPHTCSTWGNGLS